MAKRGNGQLTRLGLRIVEPYDKITGWAREEQLEVCSLRNWKWTTRNSDAISKNSAQKNSERPYKISKVHQLVISTLNFSANFFLYSNQHSLINTVTLQLLRFSRDWKKVRKENIVLRPKRKISDCQNTVTCTTDYRGFKILRVKKPFCKILVH